MEVTDRSATDLVIDAAAGEQGAWDELVTRYSGLVWSTARACGLGPADAADVAQTAWLRLAEHIDRLREPEAVGGWLASTTRREAMRVAGRLRRNALVDPAEGFERVVDVRRGPAEEMERAERHREVVAAFRSLGERCRQLLQLLVNDPPVSYEEISEVLEMPVGSIGPTRRRCLGHLKAALPDASSVPAPMERRT